jgi:catechol 2,3-dioxygenase
MTEPAIHPQTVIGHVHLKVSDIKRALAFYTEVMGFEVQQRWGDSAAFISAGGYHHHIGLNTWESRGGKAPARGTTGLYHFAILFPNRKELARALNRLLEHEYPIDGASDHGVSEAIYLRDPDGNGIEIYRDRPREEWPHTPDGVLAMVSEPIDLEGLLAELDDEAAPANAN